MRRNCGPILLHGRANEARDIDDQSHLSVAQDGRAGDSRYGLEIGFQALDDDLLLREQIIDENAHAPAVRFDDDQETLLGAPAIGLHAELVTELEDRQIFIAQTKDLGASRHSVDQLFRDLNRLDDGQQRNDVDLFTDPHQLSVEDGERERQPDANRAAVAFLGGDPYVTAQVIDIPSYHVHADAAAGHVAELIRGGKARHEYQVVDLFVG